MTQFKLDTGARLIDDDRVLIGGSPLSIFHLSEPGGRFVRALTSGNVPVTLSTGQQRLVDRLLDAGAIHPQPGRIEGDVAVVIPARDPSFTSLHLLLAAVARAAGGGAGGGDDGRGGRIGRVGEIVVVDDAGAQPIPPIAGVRVERLVVNRGPGGARNRGVELTTSEFVAFLDADTEPTVDWLEPLLAHFEDPRVGLVAARVTSRPGPTMRERYEQWRSPLDLGGEPARVRTGTRVSYVPAAALVVRRTVFDAVGGFDEALRYGEDVDLVWRLDAAGWRCRYEPASVVEHEPRPSWAAMGRQRFAYGSSAAPLAARHPGALAPARVSGWTAASWGLVAAGQPLVGLGVAAATTAALTRKLPGLRQPGRESVRLAGLGHLYGGRILAAACWRAWWPLTLVVALFSRRARRAAIAAALVPALLDWWKARPDINPATAVAVRFADDVAYGAGLWAGMLKHRSAHAAIPDLTSWPGRRSSGT